MRDLPRVLTAASVCVLSWATSANVTVAAEQPPAANTAPTETAGTSNFAVNNDDIIIEVRLRDKAILNEAMIAYMAGDDIALPLEQTMLLLEFPIRITADGAQGWFIREGRNFQLDLTNGKVQTDGNNFSFDPAQIRKTGGELYVPSRLLSQWLPIEFVANLRALSVSITPREAIAIDERVDRQEKKFGTTYYVRANNPEHKTPYQAAGIPALEVNLNAGQHNTDEAGDDTYGSYSIRARTDMAYMNGNLVVQGNEDELTDARITLNRRDPRGRIFGKLDATEVEAGDITTRSAPLVANSTSGRGIRMARRPAGYVGAQETVTLEGPLENGYEVELYRNGILINAARTGSGTTYNFADIALFGGQNELRLEFYGPQGQRRTETKRYYMGGSQVKTGEVQYDISISQPGKTVFGVAEKLTEYSDNAVAVTAKADYGISPNLSVSGGVAQTPLQDSEESRRYAFAGVRTQIEGVYTNLDVAADDKGGSAIGVGATTTMGKVNASAKYEKYLNGFDSNPTTEPDENEQLQQLTSRTSLSIDSSNIALAEGLNINAGAGANRLTYADGHTNQTLNARLTAQYKNLMVSQNLEKLSPSNAASTTKGNTQLNLHTLGANFRATADYDISPQRKTTARSANLSRAFGEYNVALGYNDDLLSDTKTHSASISKEFKYAKLGVGASSTSQPGQADDTSVYLTVSFSTFTDPKTRKTTVSGKSISNNSAVRASAFLDENQNGQRDSNESLLPDVRFTDFERRMQTTGKDGTVLLANAPTHDWSDIHMDAGSLNDPSWRASSQGIAVLPRPGVVSEVSLPVIITADIEGNVMLQAESGEQKPLGNIELQVVRINPKTNEEDVLTTTSTSFDGFYSLSGIPIGEAILRINPEQVARLAVSGQTELPISLRKDTGLLSAQNFMLTRAPITETSHAK